MSEYGYVGTWETTYSNGDTDFGAFGSVHPSPDAVAQGIIECIEEDYFENYDVGDKPREEVGRDFRKFLRAHDITEEKVRLGKYCYVSINGNEYRYRIERMYIAEGVR